MGKIKRCKKCNIDKDFDCFNKQKGAKDLLSYFCKKCNYIITLNRKRTREGLITRIYADQKSSSKKRGHNLPAYSKLEFREWMLSQNNFEELYNNWVKSGYKKGLRPSVDRQNDYKTYTINNIQLMTWAENKTKGHKDRKNGINNKQNIAVISKNIKTLEVNFYHSISQASRELNASPGNIHSCLIKNRKTAKGHEFYYQEL